MNSSSTSSRSRPARGARNAGAAAGAERLAARTPERRRAGRAGVAVARAAQCVRALADELAQGFQHAVGDAGGGSVPCSIAW